jgi:tetratricopeptide (TPR) repeat protein
LANTIAHRFLYLPSVGLIIVLAYLLDRLLETDFVKKRERSVHYFFIILPVSICIVCTLFLNYGYKNDFLMASNWVKDYPDTSSGFAILGQQYFENKQFDTAKEYFEKARARGFPETQLEMQLGISYINLGENQKARECFLRAIEHNPDFIDPYIFLANLAAAQNNDTEELFYLLEALPLDPKNLSMYQEALRILTKQERFQDVDELLNKAKSSLSPEDFKKFPANNRPH